MKRNLGAYQCQIKYKQTILKFYLNGIVEFLVNQIPAIRQIFVLSMEIWTIKQKIKNV